jgi:hypothetical protein
MCTFKHQAHNFLKNPQLKQKPRPIISYHSLFQTVGQNCMLRWFCNKLTNKKIYVNCVFQSSPFARACSVPTVMRVRDPASSVSCIDSIAQAASRAGLVFGWGLLNTWVLLPPLPYLSTHAAWTGCSVILASAFILAKSGVAYRTMLCTTGLYLYTLSALGNWWDNCTW